MTRELYDVLTHMTKCILYKRQITLSYKELKLVMKYIHELEREVSDGDEED